MKKILFSAHCRTPEQKEIAQSLLGIISSQGHTIDTVTNPDTDYDVIFAYNLKGYHRIRRLAKTKKIPVIYAVRQEDCIEEYLYDVSSISKILLINDGNELPRQLFFPEECSIYIPYPYLPPQQNIAISDSSANIVVATDDRTLLKIVPALNNYTKYNFTIVTGISSVIKETVNTNSTVLSAKRTNTIELIRNADLVIGFGRVILTALGYGKPAIVVGRYGFGRRVTPENIDQHLHALFRGRPGAQGEEAIPFHLLLHEIDSCMNATPEENKLISNSLADFLTAKYEQTAALINDLICSVCASMSVLDMRLKLSSLYRFIPYNESSYLVVDDRMLKLHAMIDQDEYDLIHSFEETTTTKAVMDKNLYRKTPKRFIAFIEYLVAYKFLVPQ